MSVLPPVGRTVSAERTVTVLPVWRRQRHLVARHDGQLRQCQDERAAKARLP
jgi:hypothetical protein